MTGLAAASPPVARPLRIRAASAFGLGLLVCVSVGALLTGLQLAVPGVRVVLRPVLHGEISTAIAFVALLAALLMVARFRRTLLMRDLLTAAGLGVLGICELLASIPASAGGYPGPYAAWAPTLGRVFGVLLLVGAAFAPAQPVHRPARALWRLSLGCGAWLAGISALTLSLGNRLALPDQTNLLTRGGHYQLLSDGAATLAVKGTCLALTILAVLGFVLRRRSTVDWFGALLVWGTTLLAFACLSDLLAPTLYEAWFPGSDVLRMLAYLALAVGAASVIRLSQRDVARLAVMEERERVARDLHDGLAQELVYILSQARRLKRRLPDAPVENLVGAAQRALDEARIAISAFRAPPEEPLAVALERLTRELGQRLELEVDLRAPRDLDVSPQQREVIMRIVAEALSNAARHGQASAASVELIADGHLWLRICDDGHGFDPVPAPGRLGSYGLLSMRERATLAGGRLAVRSAPGSSTEVEVMLP